MNRINVNNQICYIALDNGPQNSLSGPEFIDTRELIRVMEADECKAILIHGTGRHFSAGADISDIFESVANCTLASRLTAGKNLLNEIKSFNVPVVAAIEGVCFGAGLEIVLNSDIRIASQKALFAFPESNLNLMPGLTGTLSMTKIAGKAKSLQFILGGDMIDAETALETGIADRLVPSGKALETSEMLIDRMIRNRPAHVIKAIVCAVRNAENMSYRESLDEETKIFCRLAAIEAAKRNENI